MAGNLPTGMVTFLFTDIEGSTRMWEGHPDEMQGALERHDDILRTVIEANGGYVFSTAGDSFAAAFQDPDIAVEAARQTQQVLDAEPWPAHTVISVRMGLHTGETWEKDRDYFGHTLNVAARLMSAGHGGQILVSNTTNELLAGAPTVSLGEHRLKDLSQARQVWQVIDPRTFPPLRTLDRRSHNLPVEHTPLVGREADIDDVVEQIGAGRLVTLSGPGGMGKTRLAMAAAAELIDEFEDGVWLCELAGVPQGDAVAHAVARTLNTSAASGGTVAEAVGTYLRRRNLLLVLDNCEHVVDAVADLVDTILAASPATVVITTSRESIGVSGEHVMTVRSLATDGDDSPGKQLFVQRAADQVSTFDPDDSDLDTISEICRQLDGIPLAIELAAARARSMSVTEIRSRLSESFRLLRGDRHRVARHRTITAAIDWSYEDLAPEEQAAFERLSVFAGGFTISAAESVVGDDEIDAVDVLDLLDELVHKSLVVVSERGATTRFRLLEPIRQFAAARLRGRDDAELVSDRHADYYTEWARRHGPEPKAEVDNLRVALHWHLAQGRVANGLRLVRPVSSSLLLDLVLEVSDWCELACTAPGADEHPLGPQVAGQGAHAAFFRGEIDRAWRLIEMAEAMPAYRPERFYPSGTHATVLAYTTGDVDGSIQLLDGIDTSEPEAYVGVNYLGVMVDATRPEARDAVAALETVGRSFPQAAGFWFEARARLACADGDPDGVTAAADEFWSFAVDPGAAFDRYHAHHAVLARLAAACMSGDIDEAVLEAAADAVRVTRDIGQASDQWYLHDAIAKLLWLLDERDEAVRLRAAVMASPYSGAFAFCHVAALDALAAARVDEVSSLTMDDLAESTLATLEEAIDWIRAQGGSSRSPRLATFGP
ncbi:MAG: ATP-binding protein [Acidimicrobiales bacterium]